MSSPTSDPDLWFCMRVFTRSMGYTKVAPVATHNSVYTLLTLGTLLYTASEIFTLHTSGNATQRKTINTLQYLDDNAATMTFVTLGNLLLYTETHNHPSAVQTVKANLWLKLRTCWIRKSPSTFQIACDTAYGPPPTEPLPLCPSTLYAYTHHKLMFQSVVFKEYHRQPTVLLSTDPVCCCWATSWNKMSTSIGVIWVKCCASRKNSSVSMRHSHAHVSDICYYLNNNKTGKPLKLYHVTFGDVACQIALGRRDEYLADEFHVLEKRDEGNKVWIWYLLSMPAASSYRQ